MGIGKRIKEARENIGLTQTELGKLIGVTSSAITNYEKETSHPKEPILYKLIDVLDVDANFLFQDSVTVSNTDKCLSVPGTIHIKKYRHLNDLNRQAVDTTVDAMLETQGDNMEDDEDEPRTIECL